VLMNKHILFNWHTQVLQNMKEKSKEKNCISFCLPLRLYEEEFEKNLLFFCTMYNTL